MTRTAQTVKILLFDSGKVYSAKDLSITKENFKNHGIIALGGEAHLDVVTIEPHHVVVVRNNKYDIALIDAKKIAAELEEPAGDYDIGLVRLSVVVLSPYTRVEVYT